MKELLDGESVITFAIFFYVRKKEKKKKKKRRHYYLQIKI
jgi:hypothetical protein